MSETLIVVALGGLFALFMGRSAVIAIWPESDAAKFCEFQLGFLDRLNDSDGEDSDCSGGDGGAD